MHLAQPPGSFGDDLDDHSNGFTMTPANISTTHDPLDDIFGADSESSAPGMDTAGTREVRAVHGHSDISLDTRRLQAQHNTVGYREGITAGKAGSIQAGFDQGFALGANVGMRAGQILGLLEGISAALARGPADEFARADELLARAAAELNPERIFTADFWAPDGTWIYPVIPAHNGSDIVYPDVADQHPLVSKWGRIARDAAERYDVHQAMPILENSEPCVEDVSAAPDSSPRPSRRLGDVIAW